MIYATLDEAWAKKPRVKRVTQREKIKKLIPVKYEPEKIVLKDPEVVQILKEVDDPDAYILELINNPKVIVSKPKEQVKKESTTVEHKKESKKDHDDIIYFLYFLILLVLLY